jgi:hypothetical protein
MQSEKRARYNFRKHILYLLEKILLLEKHRKHRELY